MCTCLSWIFGCCLQGVYELWSTAREGAEGKGGKEQRTCRFFVYLSTSFSLSLFLFFFLSISFYFRSLASTRPMCCLHPSLCQARSLTSSLSSSIYSFFFFLSLSSAVFSPLFLYLNEPRTSFHTPACRVVVCAGSWTFALF